ncbi:hypothetical protein D9757_013499 [Collybiopsis confluens]|uniref:Uncharacterized protein n=1 Tax=Collybiopsis confluens TaxID=2823264 RepID=A0A8H5FSN7_9AGAR|nr:hypothetical protein D9757_013499 [Collybiopsis confluens]
MFNQIVLKADGGEMDNDCVKALVRCKSWLGEGHGATEFVAGGLHLGEPFSPTPGLRNMVTEPAKKDGKQYDPRKQAP